MNLRTLIVDDEPPARRLIATLLRDEPEVEVVGECEDGVSALNALQTLRPDLAFLDIQMPGLDGFGVLAQLPPERWPVVVFVTAYDRYALRAFEVHALDYLLKPFEYERLRQAVQRARQVLAQREPAGYERRLAALLEEMQAQAGRWERLVVRDNGRVLFLKPGEVDWIEAEGNYLRLHVGKAAHLVRATMGWAETRLAGLKFLRVGRSVLVNLERVKSWEPLFHGDSVLVLADGTRLGVSRGYRENLDRLLQRLE